MEIIKAVVLCNKCLNETLYDESEYIQELDINLCYNCYFSIYIADNELI